MYTNEELQAGFTIGDWVVLPGKSQLYRVANAQETQEPENKVFEVLMALARRDGDLISNDELIDEVWDGRAFSNAVIERCIRLLRVHFGDEKPFEYVGNVPRRGYRLLQRVEPLEKSEVPPVELSVSNSDDTRLWKIVAGIVAVGFIAVVAFTWQTPNEPDIRSIAILPMDNLTGDPENQYIVEGIKNSVAHRLSEIPNFSIKNLRQEDERQPSEIAAEHNVESVLVTSLQMQGDLLKVTWHIVNGSDNLTVISDEETGNLSGVFGLQEQLAQAVRDRLAGSETPQLVTRPEPASAAYNSFMRGMYLFEHRGEFDNLLAAMELFEKSIALDEDYGPAYLALATAYALLPIYGDTPAGGIPVEEIEGFHRRAINTVEAGVKADRSIEDAAGSIYGFVFHQKMQWIESEAAHLRAVNASVVDSNSFNWYSRMLASVGRREDALKWALAAENIDPDSPIVNSRIAIAYMWLGKTEKAQEYFRRASDLGARDRNQFLGTALLQLQIGDLEQAQNNAIAGGQADRAPTHWVEPVFAAFADPAQRDWVLSELDRQWTDKAVSAQIVLVARTLLGDIDGAMEIAQLLKLPGEVFEMDLLFIPEMEPLRTHPDFIPLMEDLGVVDYWASVGCQWEGSQVNCAAD